MGNSPVDRDTNYMKEVWGTTCLTTDHWSLPADASYKEPVILQEVVFDESKPINLNERDQVLADADPLSPENLDDEYKSIPNRY
jgi:hypothetical protein